VQVVELAVAETYDLRRRVLRSGTPSQEFRYAEDADASAFHLGVRDADGRVLAVATFCPEPLPDGDGRPALLLRGMAVEPDLQGTGIGRQVLDEAIGRARREGFELLWAKARDSAVGFYERLGLRTVGDGFATPETGLPHHLVILDLTI
jgi:GNAT superfamily N-acetyltransferase